MISRYIAERRETLSLSSDSVSSASADSSGASGISGMRSIETRDRAFPRERLKARSVFFAIDQSHGSKRLSSRSPGSFLSAVSRIYWESSSASSQENVCLTDQP